MVILASVSGYEKCQGTDAVCGRDIRSETAWKLLLILCLTMWRAAGCIALPPACPSAVATTARVVLARPQIGLKYAACAAGAVSSGMPAVPNSLGICCGKVRAASVLMSVRWRRGVRKLAEIAWLRATALARHGAQRRLVGGVTGRVWSLKMCAMYVQLICACAATRVGGGVAGFCSPERC